MPEHHDVTPQQAAALGWSIIPTGADKRPLAGLRWGRHQHERADGTQIAAWEQQHPAGWAVVTGAISGLVILDFDGPDGIALAQRWNIAPHVRTPSGGLHLYLRHPGWRVPTLNAKASKNTLGAAWPGLDIRADGGYALFFGSTAKGPYQWLRTPDPDDPAVVPDTACLRFLGLLPPESNDAPPKAAPPPPPAPASAGATTRRSAAATAAPHRPELDTLVRWALDHIGTYGGRNNAGTRLAQQVRDNGYSQAEASAALHEFCRRCPATDAHGAAAPYTPQEAENTVASVYRQPARQPWDDRRLPPRGPTTRGTDAHAPDDTQRTVVNPPPVDAPVVGPVDAPPPPPKRPKLYHGRQLRTTMTHIWRHLHERNERVLAAAAFSRGDEPLFAAPPDGRLVRLCRAPDADGVERLRIAPVDTVAAAGLLTREFDWLTHTEEGDKPRDPKKAAVEQVAGDAAHNPVGPLPPLHAVAMTPVFSATGALLQQPGYHRAEQLWYAPGKDLAAMPPVPENPTSTQIDDAVTLLRTDLFGDFPFAGESEAATALALCLQPFARRLIRGPSPLYLIEANTQGTGKTRLAQLCAIVATGSRAPAVPWSHNEEESRKFIAAELMRGRAFSLIDNIDTARAALSSPALATLATTEVFSDRKLGVSEVVDLPNRATWALTGNNFRVAKDLVRRFVRCRLVAQQEHPELRDPATFRHPDIEGWAMDHRAALVHACLVLVAAWLARGRVPGPVCVGSYEGWSAVMGGIMLTAGVPAFLANLRDLYAYADAETDDAASFVSAWAQARVATGQDHTLPASATDLMRICGDDLMLAARGDGPPAAQQQRLVRWLRAHHERVVDGWRIEQAMDAHAKAWRYTLRRAGAES